MPFLETDFKEQVKGIQSYGGEYLVYTKREVAYDIQLVSGIFLTEEWLLKFGFEIKKYDEYWKCYQLSNGYGVCISQLNSGLYNAGDMICSLQT